MHDGPDRSGVGEIPATRTPDERQQHPSHVVGRGVEVDALKTVMQRLVEPTGGRALFTDNIDQLHLAFSDLLEELSNQYLLGYESTNTRRDEALRNQLLPDAHSPGMFRAFVPLTNIDAFYAAFNLRPGDKLYRAPADRVKIW